MACVSANERIQCGRIIFPSYNTLHFSCAEAKNKLHTVPIYFWGKSTSILILTQACITDAAFRLIRWVTSQPMPSKESDGSQTSTKDGDGAGGWTFDEETRAYVVQCPSCDQPHLIMEDHLKCCEFSCGAHAETGQPLKPHMNKRDRDALRKRGCIIGGCGGRFKFNPRKNELSSLD